MKKIIRFFTLIMALFVSAAMYATDFTFVEGKNVLNAKDMVVNGTYTVKNTGKVLLEAAQVFAEVSCNGTTYTHSWVPGSTHGNYHYEVEAQAGQTIKVYDGFFMNSGTSLWITEMGTGPVPVNVQSVSPAQGAVFTWNQAGMMSVTFNKVVTMSGIKLLTPDNTAYDVSEIYVSNTISCNIKSALESAFADGKLAQGQTFRIRIEGICDINDKTNLYAKTGILSITYVAPALQGVMTDAKVNGYTLSEGGMNTYSVLSFYDPDGEDGLFVFTFDKGVKSVAAVKLRMGDLDRSTEGLYYEKEAPYSIQENKILVDLRGELRSYARLFPGVDLEAAGVLSEAAFQTINLSLAQVIDINGNTMASPGIGTVGSYSFNMGFKEIEDDIVMDGDREEDMEGRVKEENSRVQLWIDQQVKSIDGVSVFYQVPDIGQEGDSVYVQCEARIPAASIETLMSDPLDGTVLGFNMPAEFKGKVDVGGQQQDSYAEKGSTLRVQLSVKTMNGMPHDLVINYFYKEDTTGICELPREEKASERQAIYNLQGQRVLDTNCRGVYIIGGKKVLR